MDRKSVCERMNLMNSILDTAQMYISMAASTALMGFVVLSVILFIIDGIKAKRQQRKRKAGITVMFIIAMILEAVFIIAVVLFFYMIIVYIGSTY